MYRVGNLGWRVAARIGIPLKVRIDVIFDDEAKVFVATSEDLKGLVVEAATVEELWAEIKQCACDLLIEECQAKLPVAREEKLPETRFRMPEFQMMLHPATAIRSVTIAAAMLPSFAKS